MGLDARMAEPYGFGCGRRTIHRLGCPGGRRSRHTATRTWPRRDLRRPHLSPGARSSGGQSSCLLSSGSRVRILPGALTDLGERLHRRAFRGHYSAPAAGSSASGCAPPEGLPCFASHHARADNYPDLGRRHACSRAASRRSNRAAVKTADGRHNTTARSGYRKLRKVSETRSSFVVGIRCCQLSRTSSRMMYADLESRNCSKTRVHRRFQSGTE